MPNSLFALRIHAIREDALLELQPLVVVQVFQLHFQSPLKCSRFDAVPDIPAMCFHFINHLHVVLLSLLTRDLAAIVFSYGFLCVYHTDHIIILTPEPRIRFRKEQKYD